MKQKAAIDQTSNRVNGKATRDQHVSTIPHLPPAPHNRLDTKFEQLRARGEKALIAYVMAGDPGLRKLSNWFWRWSKLAPTLLSWAIRFRPIADGPVIQQAAERALRNGTSLRDILHSVTSLRQQTGYPIVSMVYYNSIFAMGLESFCAAAKEAGVDGMIVPDMPPDEAGPLRAPGRERVSA